MMGDLLYLVVLLMVLFSNLGFIALMVASSVVIFLVPGTRRRYEAVSVTVTLALPVAISSLVAILYYATEHRMMSVASALISAMYSYYLWKKHKDEDNWWKGRGKKWLKSIDKAISKLTPSPAVA